MTLLEMIVYIAIVTLILTTLVSVSYELINMSLEIRTAVRDLETGDYYQNEIDWNLDSSSTIDIKSLASYWAPVSDLEVVSSSTYIKVDFRVHHYFFEIIHNL